MWVLENVIFQGGARFADPLHFAGKLNTFKAEIERLDPTWAQKHRTTAYAKLEVGEVLEGWIESANLGYSEDTSYRGKTKTVPCRF